MRWSSWVSLVIIFQISLFPSLPSYSTQPLDPMANYSILQIRPQSGPIVKSPRDRGHGFIKAHLRKAELLNSPLELEENTLSHILLASGLPNTFSTLFAGSRSRQKHKPLCSSRGLRSSLLIRNIAGRAKSSELCPSIRIILPYPSQSHKIIHVFHTLLNPN
ncbi:hypothetical protein HOY80DRAFT_411848 [Tuber brumale]|nr:hypothetical protein HOY80DRAFT_411848 [Tuber brumale]